jgi:predicted oxidoreductase
MIIGRGEDDPNQLTLLGNDVLLNQSTISMGYWLIEFCNIKWNNFSLFNSCLDEKLQAVDHQDIRFYIYSIPRFIGFPKP